MIQTKTYFAFIDAAKHPAPIRDVIAAAIVACRARNPAAMPDELILHPDHAAAIGPRFDRREAAGDARCCRVYGVTYNGLIGPREVRVGPVD